MILIIFLSIICFNASSMLIWFKSDAFVEWMNLCGLSKFIKHQEYLDTKLENFTITYPLFLKMKYPNFIFKLIGCPLCLGTWLSIISSITFSKCISEDVLDFINQSIVYSPIILILTMYIYYKLSKLINENK